MASGSSKRAVVRSALLHTAQWEALERAIATEGRTIAARAALNVLSYHRARFAGASRISDSDLRSILRPLDVQAGSAPPPPLLTIGVEPAAGRAPASCTAWREDAPSGGLRAVRPHAGPARLWAAWNLRSVRTSGAIFCPARAQGRVKTWRASARKRAGALPPRSLVQSLLSFDILPTAVANPADHYWWAEAGRWWSPREVARSVGLEDDSATSRILCDSRWLTPAQAVSACGRACNAFAVARIIRHLHEAVPFPQSFTYGSAFSGIDTILDGVERALPGRVSDYVFASEQNPKTAAALVAAKGAYGLTRERVRPGATASEATNAPPVHMFALTASCGPHSSRNHSKTEDSFTANVREISAALEYVRLRRPPLVLIENVDDRDLAGAMEPILRAIPGYEWASQVVDPLVHAAVPVRRERRFWLGRCEPPTQS